MSPINTANLEAQCFWLLAPAAIRAAVGGQTAQVPPRRCALPTNVPSLPVSVLQPCYNEDDSSSKSADLADILEEDAPVNILLRAARKVRGQGKRRPQLKRRAQRGGDKSFRALPRRPNNFEAVEQVCAAAAATEPSDGAAGESDRVAAAGVRNKKLSFADDGLLEWEALQKRIRELHEWRVRRDLGPDAELSPVQPEEPVRKRFLEACALLEHSTSIGYHGTAAKNIPSISKKGLMVPGHGGVRVVNGSAHGVGIYTARLGKPSLSKGFCDSDQMFLCAICDVSAPVAESKTIQNWSPSSTIVQTFAPAHAAPRRIGSFALYQDSKEVKHVGDAMVIFKEHLVVPLFTVSKRRAPRVDAPCWEPPQQVARRQIAVPLPGEPGVVFAEDGEERRGQTVWLPAERQNGSRRVAGRNKAQARLRDRELKAWNLVDSA